MHELFSSIKTSLKHFFELGRFLWYSSRWKIAAELLLLELRELCYHIFYYILQYNTFFYSLVKIERKFFNILSSRKVYWHIPYIGANL